MLLLRSTKVVLSISVNAVFLFVCLLNYSSFSQTTKPYVITNPINQNLVVGDTLLMNVQVLGTRPFVYKWYDTAHTVISGATDSVFRKGPLALIDNKKGYYCVISNIAGSVSSGTGFVYVKRPSSELILVNGELYTKDGSIIGYPNEIIKDIVVKLYSSIGADSAVYSESFLQVDGKGVKVLQSKFVVNLGDGITSDNLRDIVRVHPDLFVEFRVCSPGGIPEIMDPRLPLTSAPYSLSGTPELLSGNIDPVPAGITAPTGTHYVNKITNKTFIKTHNSWVSMD